MKMKFVHIGMDHIIPDTEVECILPFGNSVTRRFLANAKMTATFIDATKHKKMKSIIILKNGDVVGAMLSTKALMGRFNAPANMGFQGDQDQEEEETTYL